MAKASANKAGGASTQGAKKDWPPSFAQYFYIPNIIDYLRVVALWWALQEQGQGRFHFAIWYTVSMGLDGVDGMAARYFNQCSTLGYYLDMIIDRISSITALLKAAALFTPSNLPIAYSLLACIVVVEILAHGVVMYYSEVKNVHQKNLGLEYAIVKAYLHKNKLGLAFGCISYEAMLLSIIANMVCCYSARVQPAILDRIPPA